MLFDKDGKYIDVENEAYWQIEGEGEDVYVAFVYGEECVIKPHTHNSYVDGKCAECGYTCPHDSGINDREAGYFEKAICSVCHCEYGDFAPDTTAPTGEIKVKDRTWWESFIHAITFGLFYKEKVTVEITASDDSYSQAGYNPDEHAVKIEYFISETALGEEEVKALAFKEYTDPIDLTDDQRYVIYVRLTDYAGNIAYASSGGFAIDTTAPVIEVDADGQSKRYSDGQRAEVCGDTQINFIDDNFDAAYVIIDGKKESIWGDSYFADPSNSSDAYLIERWITFEVHDKAGNISTVEVYVHKDHSFDEETGVCDYCGYQAAVLIKCSNDNNEEEFVSGGGLDETMRKADENRFDRFYLKLYGNVEKMSGAGTYGSTSKKWTFDLNGYTISNPSSVDPDSVAALFYVAGDITFVGNGAMNADVMVDGGQLTIDGECSFQKLEHKRGTLTVNAGSFESLIISKLDVGWSYTRETALYGGHYGEVKIVDIEGLTCADLLARGYRFEGLTLEQAKVTELKDAAIVACDHADIGSDGICPDCGMEFSLSVEANGTTKLFETFESAIRYAEQNDGCTVKLLKDITVAGTSSMVSHYRLALTEGSYTLDLAGKTLTVGAVEGSYLTVSVECDLTISDSVGGGKIVGETGAEAIEVRGKLTVSGGDFTEIYKIEAYGADSLVLEGGSFKMVSSAQSAEAVSPLSYLAEERAYQLTTGDNRYANESDVVRDTVGTMTTCYIRNVSVVSAPLKFHGQPRDDIYYLTMPNYEKWAIFTFLYSGGYPSKGDIAITGERIDGTVVHVADEITRLTDAVTAYDIDKVTSADKADIEKLISDIDTLLSGDNLTEAERTALEALKGTARALLDRIAAAKDAAEADEITVIDGITKDNVKLEDKEALEEAEKALEGALRDFGGNYTEEESRSLEEKLEAVKAALAAIGNAEKAAEEIGKLPSAEDAKLSDKSALDRVKKLLDGLTENEKAMLGKDARGKVDALAEKIKKLAEEANSPKTGDTSNLALWIALLFISGGIVTGTTVVGKKKKRSVK